MTDELERIWKKGYSIINVLSEHLPGNTEENHENPWSGQPVSQLRFKPKVKLSLCLTNQDVWWSGCIDPHFLDLGTSWR
jgi:hypothetical protein